MKTLLLVILALLSVSFILAQENDGYTYVVSRLGNFQTRSGSFRLRENDPATSLTATADALFLSALYGLRQQISPVAIEKYLTTLATDQETGYGKGVGLASDLESSKEAILSYAHLGRTTPGSPVKYIKNLLNAKTGLFSRVSQGEGDVVGTATALQVLDHTRESSKQWVQDLFTPLRSFLNNNKKQTANGNSYFQFKSGSSVMADNYYGIIIGSLIGYDFSSGKFAQFIVSQQASNGGFYADLERSKVTIEASAQAALSLASLGSGAIDQINSDRLFSYLYENTPRDLHLAALAHSAVAVTNNFRRNFNTTTSYEDIKSNSGVDRRVVQGSQLKPVLNVRTIFGIPHAGLDVTLQYEDASRKASTLKLKWKDNHRYSSDEFIDTSNVLGSFNFRYLVRANVAGLPGNSVPQFEVVDIKRVGYGMSIKSEAHYDVAGKTFQPGEAVAIGTNFKFALGLNNLTHERFPAKNAFDVDVVFNVLDSSNVVIHQARQSVKAGNTFEYTLTKSDLPAGALSFRFQVGQDSNIHTEEVVEYQLNIPMIATKITFDSFSHNQAPVYKIGDVVKVSMEPASYPDLRNKYPYSTKDVNGNNVGESRQFYLDVKSNNGVVVKSVLGRVRSGEVANYGFEVPVDATLDHIGANAVSFRYVAANGNSVDLSNFDSEFDELYDDTAVLNYTINSQLQIVDVEEQPKSEDYFYGNEIVFRFRVKDSVSGKYINRGEAERANVYLTLTHADEHRGRPYVSAIEAARQEGDKFVIQWPINPNAVQGAGVLSVSAQDVDGNHLDLFKSDSLKDLHRHDVNITGKIEVRENTYSSSVLAIEQTAFVVGFNLSCNDKSLRDAQLRASIVLEGSKPKTVASGLPVATNNNGQYSVTWTAPLAQTPSGRYTLNFYREVDRKRAVDNRDFKEKQARREEELRRLNENIPGEIPARVQSDSGIESELTPLFSISLVHDAPSVSKSPIRMEVLVLMALGAAFFVVSYRKKQYLLKPTK